MRLVRLLAAAGVAGGVITGSATAMQPSEKSSTGTLIPGRETSAPVGSVGYKNMKRGPTDATAAALASANLFAECVVKKRPDEARKVVLENLYDVRKRYPKLLDPNCLPDKKGFDVISKMTFPGDTFHQLLSNALVKMDFAADAPKDFSSIPMVAREAPTPVSRAELEELPPKARERAIFRQAENQTWFALAQIGECVSRRSPEGVRSLAFTPVNSSEESVAARKLQGDIAACVPAGTTIRMRVSDLRGPAVRSYYHLAQCVMTGKDNPVRLATGSLNE